MVNIAIPASFAYILSASVSLHDCSGQQVPQSRLTSGCKSSFCYWYSRRVVLPNLCLSSISYGRVGPSPLINLLVLFVMALNSTCAFCRTPLCLAQVEWASVFCNMLQRLAPSAWTGHVDATHCSSSLPASSSGKKPKLLKFLWSEFTPVYPEAMEMHICSEELWSTLESTTKV